ncbi:hypothetical protein BSKO_08699 [Bryopsis sp. KO-2023]|nr:hypothetical protein BSKO_08699 [Bryopsis sp. KO-2023]
MIRKSLVECHQESDLADLQRQRELFHRESMQAKVSLEVDEGKSNGNGGDDDASAFTGTDQDSKKTFDTKDYYSEIDTGTAPRASECTSASASTSVSGGEQVGEKQQKDFHRARAFDSLKSLYRVFDALTREIDGVIDGAVRKINLETMRRFDDLTFKYDNEIHFSRHVVHSLDVIVQEVNRMRSERIPCKL